MRRPFLALTAGLLLAAAVGPAAWGAAGKVDRIYLKNKAEPVEAEIADDTIDGVTTTSRLSFPVVGVARIDYYDRPHAYIEGDTHRKQGRYEEAIRFYESAARSQVPRKFWLEPTCLYYIALCHLEQGDDLDKAEATFTELLQKHPKTRFWPNAVLGLGRVQFARKNHAGALAQFDKLAAEAAGRDWEEWLYRSYLWRARVLLEQKNYEAALQAVRKIVDSPAQEKYADIVIQARTVEATIHVRRGDYAKAQSLLRDLIKQIGPAVAKEIGRGAGERMQITEAQCYNALGECYLKQAAKSNKADDYREAVLAFLWTVLLYQRLPAEHAEALFYSAECFEKLGQRDRATELRNELVEKYPDNPLARQIGSPKSAASKKESEK